MYAFNSRVCILRSAPRCPKKSYRHVDTRRTIFTTSLTHSPPSLTSAKSADSQSSGKANSRIANSLSGIAILSAGETAQKRSEQGTSYKPDLGYLKKSPKSFAGQLAADTIRAEASVSSADTVDRKNKMDTGGATTKVLKQEGIMGTDTKGEKTVSLHKPSHVQKDLRGQRAPSSPPKPQSLPRKHSSQKMQISPDKPASLETQGEDKYKAILTSISLRYAESLALQREDITYELLEDGGDNKEFADSMTPDIQPTNLATLFGNRGKTGLSLKRWKQAKVLRGISHMNTNHSAAVHNNMNPLKHARLILGRKSDATLVTRKKALEAITSMLHSTDKAISKASTS